MISISQFLTRPGYTATLHLSREIKALLFNVSDFFSPVSFLLLCYFAGALSLHHDLPFQPQFYYPGLSFDFASLPGCGLLHDFAAQFPWAVAPI